MRVLSVYVELGGQGQELWPPELFVPLQQRQRHSTICSGLAREILYFRGSRLMPFLAKRLNLALHRRRPRGTGRPDAEFLLGSRWCGKDIAR